MLNVYKQAIATSQGDGANANGIPTVVFNDDVTLEATVNTPDQRFAMDRSPNGRAIIFNIARDKTVTIKGNKTADSKPLNGGAMNIDQQYNSFAQNCDGKLVFSNNVASYGGAVYLLTSSASFGSKIAFVSNKSASTGGAIYSSSNSIIIIGYNTLFMTMFRLGRSIVAVGLF